jgi:hypothetical protein
MASTKGPVEMGGKILFQLLSYAESNAAGPRLGRLSLPNRRDLETPNFFAVTSRGVVPHLTPDVISAHTRIGGVHMALEDCEYKNRSRALYHLLTLFSRRKSNERHAAYNELPWALATSCIYSTPNISSQSARTSSYSSSLRCQWQQQHCHINLHFNRLSGPLK